VIVTVVVVVFELTAQIQVCALELGVNNEIVMSVRTSDDPLCSRPIYLYRTAPRDFQESVPSFAPMNESQEGVARGSPKLRISVCLFSLMRTLAVSGRTDDGRKRQVWIFPEWHY
jgi:hypothetical protein